MQIELPEFVLFSHELIQNQISQEKTTNYFNSNFPQTHAFPGKDLYFFSNSPSLQILMLLRHTY